MRGRIAFTTLALLVSVGLFAVWPQLMAAYSVLLRLVTGQADVFAFSAGNAGLRFLVPVVAVIACALGERWQRKLLYLGVVAGGFATFHLLVLASGAQRLLVATPDFKGHPVGSAMTVLVYHTFDFAFPLAVLSVFVGADPIRLWRTTTHETETAKSSSRA